MSRTTDEGPKNERPDDEDCVVCGEEADGFDARRGAPTCRLCARLRTDGGRDLYSCDTPNCYGEKEVITPDGYVCEDCADELAVRYEEVDRGDGVISDGGNDE